VRKTHEILKETMAGGGWWPLHTLHAILEAELGTLAETNTAARIRDLRKKENGKLKIESRKREGSAGWEYRWVQAGVTPAEEPHEHEEKVRRADARAVIDARNADMKGTLARMRA